MPWGCAGRAVAARALHPVNIPEVLSFQDKSPAGFRMIIGQTLPIECRQDQISHAEID